MATFLELLNSDLGKQIIHGASSETGADENKTAQVVTMALPLLLGAMKKNASSDQGAQSLLNALNNKHDGSILDNLGGLFNNGVDHSVINDGAGILRHVLGNKQSGVEQALSQKSGLDANTVGQILKIAAPILLGMLGKETRQSNANNPGALMDVIGQVIGGKTQEEQSLLHTLLDSDGDGSVIDDIAGMVLGSASSKKSSGGLGGLLGGLFKK
jgi:hypothetical protein